MSNSMSNAGAVHGNSGHNGNGTSSKPIPITPITVKSNAGGSPTSLPLIGLSPVVRAVCEAYHAAAFAAAQEVFTAMGRAAPDHKSLAPTPEESDWQLCTLEDALQPRPPLEYLVSNLVPLPSLSIFYGPPASLKSMVLMDMAISVATGTPFLPNQAGEGGFSTTQAPVLWYDYDNGKRRCAERFGAMAKKRGLSLDRPLSDIPFYYVSVPSHALNLNDAESVAHLSRIVESKGIKLLVIDNLGAASGGVDENSTQMVPVMGNLRRTAEQFGLACIVIHHARKQGSIDGRAANALRGSSAIEAALDFLFRVDRKGTAKEVTIVTDKARGYENPPIGAHFDITNRPEDNELETARFYGTSAVDNRSTPAIEQAILAVVQEQPSIKQGDLTQKVKDKLGIGGKYIPDIAKKMAEDGLLAAEKGPHNATMYSLPGSSSDSEKSKEED